MDFLGVGPLELIFVFILVILVFGPQDLAKAGKTIGRFLNKVVSSESWRAIQAVNREIKDIPNRLVREANLEDTLNDVVENTASPLNLYEGNQPSSLPSEKEFAEGIKAWTTPAGVKSTEPEV